MKSCCCQLAGTKACENCVNNGAGYLGNTTISTNKEYKIFEGYVQVVDTEKEQMREDIEYLVKELNRLNNNCNTDLKIDMVRTIEIAKRYGVEI